MTFYVFESSYHLLPV